MDERELRALVREAVERHLGRPQMGPAGPVSHINQAGHAVLARSVEPSAAPLAGAGAHPSHYFLNVVPGSAVDDGMCVIEPAVSCNHCGFCRSLGH